MNIDQAIKAIANSQKTGNRQLRLTIKSIESIPADDYGSSMPDLWAYTRVTYNETDVEGYMQIMDALYLLLLAKDNINEDEKITLSYLETLIRERDESERNAGEDL